MKAGRAGLPLAIALSLAFLAQGLLGNRDKSLTWDEPVARAGHSIYIYHFPEP